MVTRLGIMVTPMWCVFTGCVIPWCPIEEREFGGVPKSLNGGVWFGQLSV